MNASPAQLSRRLIVEALNGRNLSVVDELVAADYQELDPMPGQAQGPEGVRQVFGSLHEAFSDLHYEIQEQISEGNRVMTRYVWTGTHDGDLSGIPPTGLRVEVQGVVIDEYRGDQVVRSRFMNDDLTMQRQLGFISSAAPAGYRPFDDEA